MTLLVEVNKTENGKIYESTLIHRRWCSLGVILLSRLSVMPKIVFIGAGSTVFAKNLLGDILSIPELSHSEIFLQDIDTSRLETSRIVAEKICSTLEVQPKIETTTNQVAALEDADYVISMFQVGGYDPATKIDFDIPKKYGLEQTIGDTVGIGGIMRAIRTIPVLLGVVKDMEEVCGEATLLNYVNPMAMLCQAVTESSSIRTVGLCHSVQHTAHQIAQDIEVPIGEVQYLCAGINHLAFYLKFELDTPKGPIDLYPMIHERAQGDAPLRPMPGTEGLSDAVRYEMVKRLGYFVTESSEHFSEYVPWFLKTGRDDLIEQFGIPLDEYPRRCEYQIASWEKLRSKLENPEEEIRIRPSNEYGAGIIHSLETGTPRIFNGNVPNKQLITNLPEGCWVEVPCTVDDQGIHPHTVGDLPPQLVALMQTNINVQSLVVEAVLTGNRDHIYHAAMFDPHTASELSLEEIWLLVDELLEAHGDMIPSSLQVN